MSVFSVKRPLPKIPEGLVVQEVEITPQLVLLTGGAVVVLVSPEGLIELKRPEYLHLFDVLEAVKHGRPLQGIDARTGAKLTAWEDDHNVGELVYLMALAAQKYKKLRRRGVPPSVR
jgi:hypothetical protein